MTQAPQPETDSSTQPALDLKALEEMARVYHEAKHFILGKVDRERFPSYLECPYWPCRDARIAIEEAQS